MMVIQVRRNIKLTIFVWIVMCRGLSCIGVKKAARTSLLYVNGDLITNAYHADFCYSYHDSVHGIFVSIVSMVYHTNCLFFDCGIFVLEHYYHNFCLVLDTPALLFHAEINCTRPGLYLLWKWDSLNHNFWIEFCLNLLYQYHLWSMRHCWLQYLLFLLVVIFNDSFSWDVNCAVLCVK